MYGVPKNRASFLYSDHHTTGGDTKTETHCSPLLGEVNPSTDKVLGAVVDPGMTKALELRNPPSVNVAKTNPATIPQPGAMLPSEAWSPV
jgi:plant G-box-binding factor